ncbi:DUF6801 domain-containing protein [Amycolatopsis solani]|uniref:DUF6801 domain-containing protein n=1 Tax=Amycolatopsis solani TaxID=3028615 RepID=UPI0025AFCCC7|nr:DUF6801 domain-containing protein [Amycolatopsis sp. MEP2-6]
MPRRVRPRTLTISALAAVGLLSAVNGALTGVGSAAPAPAVPPDTKAATSVSVTCPFADPPGPRALTVETAATLPAQAKTGAAATIRDFSVKLTLSRDLALSLLPDGATTGSLQGTAVTNLAVRQGDRADRIPVPVVVAATPLPETGDVTLTGIGTVPPIAINTVGPVTLEVTAPTLALTAVSPPGTTEAAQPAPGIACTLDPGQPSALGKIQVLPKTAPGTKQNQQAPPGGVATQDEPIPPIEITTPLALVSVLTTSTVTKLGAKVAADPAFLINGQFLLSLDAESGEIVDRRVTGSTVFKPATVTFLGFGFVPVSATIEFLPLDYRDSKLIEISGGLHDDPVTGEPVLDTQLSVMARLSGAKVNGVPLDLGPDCVTAGPVKLELSGPYDPFSIGHIRTDPAKGFDLPAFRGCGAGGQDLNPLLTGMSSGPGNQAFVDTYNLLVCTEPDHTQCPEGSDPPAPGGTPAQRTQKAVTKPN